MPHSRTTLTGLFTTLIAIALAHPAEATDGKLEINNVCANGLTGCFPGDTPGGPPLAVFLCEACSRLLQGAHHRGGHAEANVCGGVWWLYLEFPTGVCPSR